MYDAQIVVLDQLAAVPQIIKRWALRLTFFFFQAEDGIRDIGVTGVQTCALPILRIALRLGLYQLRFLTRIPASAAVNESVSLVRVARLSSATAFVNAVLRRAIREAEYDPAAEVSDPLEKIAVQTSHPSWLIDRWARSFGVAEAEVFARANNVVPLTAFRVVATKASEPDVASKLRAAG